MAATTVSFINVKGGVGKTTLAMQVVHSIGSTKRVLAVDLDPQSLRRHGRGAPVVGLLTLAVRWSRRE